MKRKLCELETNENEGRDFRNAFGRTREEEAEIIKQDQALCELFAYGKGIKSCTEATRLFWLKREEERLEEEMRLQDKESKMQLS